MPSRGWSVRCCPRQPWRDKVLQSIDLACMERSYAHQDQTRRMVVMLPCWKHIGTPGPKAVALDLAAGAVEIQIPTEPRSTSDPACGATPRAATPTPSRAMIARFSPGSRLGPVPCWRSASKLPSLRDSPDRLHRCRRERTQSSQGDSSVTAWNCRGCTPLIPNPGRRHRVSSSEGKRRGHLRRFRAIRSVVKVEPTGTSRVVVRIEMVRDLSCYRPSAAAGR